MLFFVLLGVLLYWYTLPYPFVFDSRFYLLNNPLISDFSSFVKLLDIPDFADDYLELGIHRDVVVTFILRPFSNFTFYLNHLFDAFDPEGYRVVNIAIHIANTLLWYLFLKLVIYFRNVDDRTGRQRFIPFFSALFFLVHPLATESVTYVIQRYTSLGTLFYLLTMLLFLISLTSNGIWQRRSAYIGSIVTLVIGMMTKENLVTAPFALILVGALLLRLPRRNVVLRTLPHLLCLPIIPVVVYLVSTAQLNDTSLVTMHRIIDGYPPYEYAITEARVVLTYLRMVIAPYNQNLDPSYPLYRSIANPEIIISLILLLFFATAAVVLSLRKPRSFNNDLLSFCISFSFMAVSVSSLYPLPDLMAEHRSYLFSIPVITGLVARIDSIKGQLTHRWVAMVTGLLCVLAVVYSVATVKRNILYRSRTIMWEDAVSKSPDKWRPNYNAGWAAVNEHQYDKALHYFQRSIRINPLKIEGYANLGSTYMYMDDYYSAIEAYRKGLTVQVDNSVLLVNLGNAYRAAGQLQDAIKVYEQALSGTPDLNMLYGTLAELYSAIGESHKALKYVRKAREIDDQDVSMEILERALLE